MDLGLLFVLPLIGGFALVSRFEPLRYRAGRVEAQRLYYDAAGWAILLLLIALALHASLVRWSSYDSAIRWLAYEVVLPVSYKETPPNVAEAARAANAATAAPSSAGQAKRAAVVRAEITVICVWALLLGVGAPMWNRVLAYIDRHWVSAGPPGRMSVMKRWNRQSITDQLEGLIADSVLFARPIQLSLSNAKVYVGNVLSTIDPSGQTKHIKLQPLMSGHRSSDDGTVLFNTFYDEAAKTLPPDRAALFELVVPVDQIVTASGFDFTAYAQFSLQRKQDATTEPGALDRTPASPSAAKPGPDAETG